MPDFAEMVMVETNGPKDMDHGISLGAGLILRQDGEILSPDAHVNPLGEFASVTDIRDVISRQVLNVLEDQIQSLASEEIKEQITNKILELLQNSPDSRFNEFSDVVQTALQEVSQKVLENVEVILLAQRILQDMASNLL